MAKQLNVNLAMTADTSKAKMELQALQKQLDNLMMSAQRKDSSLGLSSEIQKATQMAAQLKVQLESATSSTGKLDLTKFNEGLQKSGLKLKDYRTVLSSLGPEGSQAFSKLASSIMQAEVPLRRSNALLSNFATTLKNTARWQISSSILHGFMGALQGAYGYAQDLNESLNNIRIVTGQSIDQMAKFANEANRAAKALSASTTAYTDAALIYYQQGLDDKAVRERTDVTIKLSNVSRQSAEEVSSQMTAIWNNFADGSKQLEYYADVITKLGAATAASSAEISDGIQKFAAVADTVGLSYEKATAALATVVAETRQSADVVGTAFKTMFARFQGLELGETLEDGVTLNKYAEAINTVGVNILKANGDLKDMDTILDELGERWNSIGQAQKVALAETVAGTRQYAQFMAIMENYDKILANQDLAAGAEGTLQKQADIYAESWEAAGKRVRAASQAIYQDLLDDKFFIKLLNWLEKTLSFLDKFIDNIGGLKGVLVTLGSVITTVFGPQIQASINNMVSSIAMMTPKGQAAAQNLRQNATDELLKMANTSANSKNAAQEGAGMQAAYSNQAKLQQTLLDNAKFLTEEEQKRAQLILDMNVKMGEEVIKAGKIADARERELKVLGKKQLRDASKQAKQDGKVIDPAVVTAAENMQKTLAGSAKSAELLRSVSTQVENSFTNTNQSLKVGDAETKKIVSNFKDILQSGLERLEKIDFGKFGPDQETEQKMQRLRELINLCGEDFSKLNQQQLDELATEIAFVSSEFEEAAEKIDTEVIDTDGVETLTGAYIAAGQESTKAAAAAEEFIVGARETGSSSVDASDGVIQLKNAAEQGSEAIRKMGQQSIDFGAIMSTVASTVMGVASAINTIKNLGNIWNDDDLTLGEKILQIMMSFGTILPVIANMTKLQTTLNGILAASEVMVQIPLVAIYAIVAALILIGWGLVKLFEAIKAKSPEGQLKKLKEEQEGLAKATEEARKEWEKFQDALSHYDEGLEGLKKLTKGTNEFNEKLKEVNDTAEEIIKSLSLVFGEDYYFDNDTGAKVFTKRGNEKIKEANNTVARGDQSLNWISLQQDNKAQKLQYENTVGRTADEREAYVREKSYKALQEEYGVLKGNQNLYENLYRDVKNYQKDMGEDFSFDDIITQLAQDYSESVNTEETDFSGLVTAISKAITDASDVVNTPFQFDYNQEQAWIASQLNTQNPYSQTIAQQMFKDQDEVEQYRINQLAKYTDSQEIDDAEIDAKWESLFGALADKGASILEESGMDKRQYLAEYSVGEHYLEQAQNILDQISNISFSKENKDILTNILTNNLQKISPEDMKKFAFTSSEEEESFKQMYETIYGKPLEDVNAYIEELQQKLYHPEEFYRNSIKGVASIQESVADLSKTLGSLEFGDIIDPDVYNNLSEDMQSYFTIMEDGTYKLIGDAEQFQAAVFREKASQFENDLQQYANLSNTTRSSEDIFIGKATLPGNTSGMITVDQQGLTEEEYKAMEQTAIGYAMATDSLEQLNYVKQQFNKLSIPEETQTKAINNALQDLASKYDTCSDELKDFQAALRLGDKTLIANTKDALKYSIQTAELAKKMDLSVDDIEDQAKAFQKENQALQNNVKNIKNQQKVATQMAVLNQSMNKGVTTLAANWEDWNKILQAGDKTSMDYIDTVQQMRTALADLLGITDEDLIPKDFFDVPDNLDNMELAAQGDVQAINLLGTAFAQSFIESQTYVDGMNASLTSMFDPSNMASMDEFLTGLTDGLADSETAFNYYRDNVLEGITNLQDAIKNGTLEAGQDITSLMDGTGASWVDSLNAMAIATGMSVDEMRSLLNSLGVEAEIGVKEETVHQKVPRYLTKTEIVKQGDFFTGDGRVVATSTYQDGYDEFDGVMEVAQINMGEENAGKQPKTVRYAGRSTPSTTALSGGKSGSGSGGGKDPTYQQKQKKDEEYRYVDIENHLKTLTKQYDRMREAREHAYGVAKFDMIKEEIKFLDQVKEAQSAYFNELLGEDWQQVYEKIKNGGVITPDDIKDGDLWRDLNDFYNTKISYAYTYGSGSSDQLEETVDLNDVLPGFQLDLDRGFVGNEQEFKEKLQDWYNAEIDAYNAAIKLNPDDLDAKNRLAWVEAVYASLGESYGKLENTLDFTYDKMDEYTDYDYQKQELEDLLPRQQIEQIEDEEHRYDELRKTLEGLVNQYDRLGKARERAWGEARLKLLDKESKKLEQLQKTYERYLKTIAGENWQLLHGVLQAGGNLGNVIASGRAGGNLQKDYDKIAKPLAKAVEYIITDEKGHQQRKTEDWEGLKKVLGLDIILDEFGQIANSDDIADALENWDKNFYAKFENPLKTELENGEARARAEADGTIEAHEKMKEYIKKILEQYAETINTFVENSDAYMDNLYEQQAKNYEKFRYKIDLKIDISERSLKRIEYAIKVLGDNIYKIPEIMQSWYDKRVTGTLGEIQKQGSTWASGFEEATSQYKSGEISQADYVQYIKDAQDGLYGCIDALLEINEEMREYYKNVLSRVKDEMSRITDEMDHQLDTVNHLQNVLSLLGRETDYEAIGKILEAQMKMTENSYEVSKAQTEMYRQQVELAEQNLQDLINQGVSDAALEEWKNAVLYPAEEALREAEAKMQSDFEAYLEVVNAIFENKINKIYQDSERRLSGAWGSFDQLNNAMERQRALDEEYLTKTNQIYETNTLLRKLAQDIDKTNNASSKVKLKNFADEIEGLQQKNKLSKSELDIAKARYEVLQAEIALEDAKNAKSTVRLQRDNEGNYGYVYTADQAAIDNAEQNLADKNNDLYNLVLNQANNYTEKIIQLTQQRNSELKELDLAWQEGKIADEATYHKLREDIVNKYNSLIQEDYESYYRALYWLDETATTDHTEAWGTSFQDVLDAQQDFNEETDQLTQETGQIIDWLSGVRAKATDEAKVGNGELEQQLKDLTDQNDALAKKMKEEVIPAAGDTLTKAQELTKEWGLQYDKIMELVNAYLALIDAMQKVLEEMSGLEEEMPEEEPEEFDITKDYSQAATEAFRKSGNHVTDEVIQALLFRQEKEGIVGHNDNNFTNEQLLELFLRAESENRQDLLDFIDQILNNEAFYTVDHADELGITGDGYSLEDFGGSVDAGTEAQAEGNDLQQQANDQAAQDQEADDARADKEIEAGDDQTDKEVEAEKSAADQNKETADGLVASTKEVVEDYKTSTDEFVVRVEEAIDENNEALNENTIALHDNADTVSTAVTNAALTIANAIVIAADAAREAEDAAARAEAAADAAMSSAGEVVNSATDSSSGGGHNKIGGGMGGPRNTNVQMEFASGGYTGSWGSSGKIAVLHEKELVLNANDTENILAAVGLLRDFSSAIDFRAASSAISTGLSSPSYQAGSQTLEQEVTIHAEFPNATNHSEIEEAFNNLINRASQYANRS